MSNPVPALKRMKSGYFRAWIRGQWRYFGKEPNEAARRYALALQDRSPDGPTIGDVIIWARDWAHRNYRQTQRWGGEPSTVKYALRFLDTRLDGEALLRLSANSFTVRHLDAVRRQMIDDGLSRSYINAQVKRIVRVFAAARIAGLVERAVVQDLQSLPALREGHAHVKDNPPVQPAGEHEIDAALPHLSPIMRAIVMVLRLTGMRVGELLKMRVGMLDTSQEIWAYDLGTQHKTSRGRHGKLIAIGPRAQQVIRPWLDAALAKHSTQAPVWPTSNVRCKIDTIAVSSVNDAIQLACAKAGIQRFTTHQIRHTKATRTAEREVLNVVKRVLGHQSISSSRLYAELDAVQIEHARQTG